MERTREILEANKALVATLLDRFSQGDVAGVLELLTPDGTWWVAGSLEGTSGTHGKEELGRLLQGAASLYEGGAMRFTPDRMIAEGNFVAAEADSYAELKNGRVYRNRYHLLFEIVDGKIRSVREYMDTKHAHETFIAP